MLLVRVFVFIRWGRSVIQLSGLTEVFALFLDVCSWPIKSGGYWCVDWIRILWWVIGGKAPLDILHTYRDLVSKVTLPSSAYLYLDCPGACHLLISFEKITAGGGTLSSFVLTWPRQESKTERERKQCFILQHLVQSAPWGWTPLGGSAPVVRESGGCKRALFFYSIKNACGWSALWIACRATSNISV